MKKIILMVAVVMAASFEQTVLACNPGGLKIAKTILESFRKDFILTSEARWNKIGEAFVVDFKQEGIAYTAYYTEEGTLHSISNNIEKDKLPEAVTEKIYTKYGNVHIVRSLKVRSLPDGIFYVVQLYTGSGQKIIKAYWNGDIEILKSTR